MFMCVLVSEMASCKVPVMAAVVQFKPRQGNPGLELRTWGHPAVADCTVKVDEAKGGDWAGTQDKWRLMEVDRCALNRRVQGRE